MGRKRVNPEKFCCDCGKKVSAASVRCKPCLNKHQIKHMYVCKGCGVTYYNKRRTNKEGHKYCSKQCCGVYKRTEESRRAMALARRAMLLARELKKCVECGGMFKDRTANNTVIYCSPRCRYQPVLRERSKAYHDNFVPKQCVCAYCDKPFSTTSDRGRNRTKFCTERCAHKYFRKIHGKTHISRARRFGVPYEYVNVYLIFDRDGWKCMMCGKDTPKARRGTRYSNAPELDHIVPLSKGGPHVYANLQCSCRQCNTNKGDRMVVSQMSMEL